MAKRAFSHCADDYARSRPSYPPGVLEVLADRFGPAPGHTSADVGAGTGIFSSLLADAGWSVVAVDVDPGLLLRVPACDPPVRRVGACAERTALADACVDLVTCAQAFHWFNPPVALAEFARILKPGGGLALVWNNRDASKSDFVRRYEQLIKVYNPAYDREYRQQDWAAKITQAGRFSPATYRRFDSVWELSADGFVGFSRSVSYIRNVLSRDQMPRFEGDLRRLMEQVFADGPCRVPLRTDLWTCAKSA